MKEVQTGETTRTAQISARWYLAATLAERVAQGGSDTMPGVGQMKMTDTEQGEQASRRLRKWQSLPPFQRSAQVFAQRLEAEGLTKETLQTLLGQSAEEVKQSCAVQPAWLVELLSAFAEPDPAVLACLPLEHLGDPATDAAFLALKPLLARGFARLLAGIVQFQQHYPRLPFDPRTVGFLLLPHFLDRILNKPAKTLVLELNVARVQGRLQGETPQERYLYFLQQLAQPEHMLNLLEEYPVLARQLVEMTGRWVERSLELLQRLCDDWDEILAQFGPDSDPGVLSEIREGAGDAHNGERSVTMLTWTSGLRLVYKPRSLSIDVHFQEMLQWLNAHGCQPAFRTFKLLNKEGYGWYEFVQARECSNKEEVQRFYQRMGGYLALLYVLEATDFHAENILATGEDPMLVDLESLFTPHAVRYEGVDRYGYELLTHTVRRVGLLPQHQWANEQTRGSDLSGLGAASDQRVGTAANTWSGLGTDEMQVNKGVIEVALGAHRPKLQGTEVETLAYEQQIIAGFTSVYRILLQQRAELLQTILPRFSNDEVRVLFRQTQQYARLLSDGAHPDVLRDALDRDWLFDRLWIGAEGDPHLMRLIMAEKVDLQNNDIPKFTTRPDSHDLFSARGTRIANFFPLSGLELVKEGVQRLSLEDLERQVWIIRASFACMEMNRTEIKSRPGLQLQPAATVATPAQFIAQAKAIGERLEQLAVIDGETIGWLVVNLTAGIEWSPTPMGPDLYNGLPGTTLFLAYLGALSGEQHYTDLARRGVKTLQTFFVPRAGIWQWGQIGAFDGAGSLIYLFAHLGALWNDPTLYEEARAIVPTIETLLTREQPFEMLAGAAGTIGALLSLYAVAPDEETLTMAVRCGDYLLQHARPMARGIAWSLQDDALPLAGLSHGNAGIALNLLRLADISGEKRFHEAALAAMEYERGIFSPEKSNWPDLRDTPPQIEDNETPGYKYMTAWCHGAPGVGMARLASLPYHDDEAIRDEIGAAIQTTLKEGFGRNHSLCHGDMGNLEVLLLANSQLQNAHIKEQTATIQAILLENIQAQGWQSGVPFPVETPGLMLGLSGTGYALLRMADPARVPSLLTLAPPPGQRPTQA